MIRRILMAAALAGLVLSSCAHTGPPSTARTDDGRYATNFQVDDIATGEEVDLADLQGAPVLLSSWATWCEECRTELPALDRWAQHANDKVTVVAVNVNLAGPADDEIDSILDELDLTMPTWRDDQNLFARTFRTFGVPANVLLDADGHVVATWNGAIDPEEPEVATALAEALATTQG